MKGQFMVISSIVVGVILITASSAIDKARGETFEPRPDVYKINMLKDEAAKVDKSKIKGRENFRRQVEMLNSFRSTVDYYSGDRCFNVTLKKPGRRYDLGCIG